MTTRRRSQGIPRVKKMQLPPKPKKAKKGKVIEKVMVEFLDGPRQGDKIEFVSPPPSMVRMAFPEWGTYELVGANQYRHIGDIKIPLGAITW